MCKGGVGTSTVAAALALGWVKKGRTVHLSLTDQDGLVDAAEAYLRQLMHSLEMQTGAVAHVITPLSGPQDTVFT